MCVGQPALHAAAGLHSRTAVGEPGRQPRQPRHLLPRAVHLHHTVNCIQSDTVVYLEGFRQTGSEEMAALHPPARALPRPAALLLQREKAAAEDPAARLQHRRLPGLGVEAGLAADQLTAYTPITCTPTKIES